MRKLFIAITLILAFTYGIPLLFNESILLYFGDSIETMYPYFVHLSEQIRSGNLFQWNHSMGFGTNNMVNFFNGLGSPFVYFAALFPRSWMPYLFLFLDVIRYYLMAYFAWLWSGKLFQKDESRFIFSLVFVFSGWVMHFIHFGFYLDGYMYLPLLLYLSDEIIEGRKSILFVFAVALTAFISPYFLYMHSIYLLFYQIFRFASQADFSVQKLFSSFLKVLGFYLLGIGLAAFVLIPEIRIVLTSPRIAINLLDNVSFDFSLHRFYNFVTSFFSPVLNDYNPNLFFSRYNVLDKSIFYNFTSVLTLIALVYLPWLKFPQKKAFLFFFGCLLLVSFIPLANVLLNGNDNVRWHFMISTTALIGLGYTIDNEIPIKKRWIGLSIVLIYCVLYFISRSTHLIDREFYRTQYIVLAFVLGLSLIYVFVLSKKSLRAFIPLIICIEMVFVLLFRMNNGLQIRYIKAEDFYGLNKAQYVDLYEKLNDSLEGYGRIDAYEAFGNDAIINGYSGFTFYSSLYNHEIREFLDGRFTPNWNMGYAHSKMLLKHFAGAKYFVTEQDFDNAGFGYDLIKTTQGKDIYQQRYENGFGYAYDQVFDMNQIRNLDKSLQDFYFFQAAWAERGSGTTQVVVPETVYLSFQNEYIDFSNRDDGYFIFDFSRSNPAVSCQLDYYKDGVIKVTNIVQEYGYTYLPVNKDYDGFYAYCTSVHNVNEYVPSNVYYISNQNLDHLYTSFEQRTRVNVLDNQNDYIQAEVTVEKASTIITVIAYDQGWSVIVDGKQVEIIKANDAFLGFEVDKGQHTIELRYKAPGLVLGLFLSAGSLLIIIVFMLMQKKSIKRQTH